MLEYLLTHPSLFIITFTIITIMLIYVFRDKIKSNYVKVEDTCMESTCSIEMQTMTTSSNICYDEPDLLAPLPNPKLYKKMRNDLKKPGTKNDIPRIHGIPEVTEPSPSNLPSNLSSKHDYQIIDSLKTSGSHLENLEKKYKPIKMPIVPTIFEINENPEITEKTENISMEPVVHRVKSNKNTDNRISVSEVHKHGSYVSFDGEFDQFDDLSRRSNVMKVTINFDPDEEPVYV